MDLIEFIPTTTLSAQALYGTDLSLLVRSKNTTLAVVMEWKEFGG